MAVALNESNYVKRKDYGVKVARPYYDVRNCADNQLLFNSSWPILQITGVYKESVVKTVGSAPSGATVVTASTFNYDRCGVDSENAYSKAEFITYISGSTTYNVQKLYGCRHGLGYPPIAFTTKSISSLNGYILVTNIDISTDVDYPYTDSPLEYFGGDLDYGVKTRAYYRATMPHSSEILGYGINTNLSSKMVQAVKTQDTIVAGDSSNKYINWEPPRDNQGNIMSKIEDFEYFSYGMQTGTGTINDNIYLPIGTAVMPMGATYSNAEYVSVRSFQADPNYTKVSLVVLRSPMVSPNIVGVTYGG